jgi:hypothetical protein
MSGERSFLEVLELFLTGEVEELWHDKEKNSVRIGNLLWDKMPSVNDIRPLFYSRLESCQYWGTYIINEGSNQGREVMDMVVCLAGSQFASVRYNICSALWAFWDIKYSDALVLFLNDQEEPIRMVAISLLGEIPEEDFRYITRKLELDKYTLSRLHHVIKYYNALRADMVSELSDIAVNSNDEVLKTIDLGRAEKQSKGL